MFFIMLNLQNILVADDHELVIQGVCNILNDAFDIQCVATFTDPEEVLEEILRCAFDLYILDLEFERMSGFELIRQIRQVHAEAKIIVVTMHDEIWHVNHLLQLQVNGVLLKRTSSDYLVKAVEAVMDNQSFFCPAFKQVQARSAAYSRDRKPVNKISPSEQTVLQHIVNGYTSKQIADAMCLTENTIEAHRKSLFLKLEARNMAHLVSIAIRQRLVE